MASCGDAEPITLWVLTENQHSIKNISYGSTKSLARPPSEPNAVRRGANHHTMRRPAWFARGLDREDHE